MSFSSLAFSPKLHYLTSYQSTNRLHRPIGQSEASSIQHLSISTSRVSISSRNQFQIQFKSNRQTNQNEYNNNPSKMNQHYGRASLGLFQAGLKWISTSLQFVSVLILASSLIALAIAPAHFGISSTNGLSASHIRWPRNGIGYIEFASFGLNQHGIGCIESSKLQFLILFAQTSAAIHPCNSVTAVFE